MDSTIVRRTETSIVSFMIPPPGEPISTRVQASALLILSARLSLGEKLQDPADVMVRFLGMRAYLGPARMWNQTMHLLGHATGWMSLFPGIIRVGVRTSLSRFSLLPRVRYGPSKRA